MLNKPSENVCVGTIAADPVYQNHIAVSVTCNHPKYADPMTSAKRAEESPNV